VHSTNLAFYFVQRAAAQPNEKRDRGYGLIEARQIF
jgi:hypothetical protein